MQQKRLITLLFLIFISCHFSMAQSDRIGVSFSSLADIEVIRFQSLTGTASYNGDGFYAFGLDYIHPFNNWLELETGLTYAHYSFAISSAPSNMGATLSNTNKSLLDIPISVRANFLKYFFINGGLLLDIDLSNAARIDNQTGIGALIGIAVKYDFDCGLGVFVNPYIKAHALIPFTSENYHQRLFEAAFRFGLTYPLKKMEKD